MKIISFIINILTLISAIICLYTLISIFGDVIVDNETFTDILLYNLFACPVLSIINCSLNLNREEKKENE
jgi:hypothetical protein